MEAANCLCNLVRVHGLFGLRDGHHDGRDQPLACLDGVLQLLLQAEAPAEADAGALLQEWPREVGHPLGCDEEPEGGVGRVDQEVVAHLVELPQKVGIQMALLHDDPLPGRRGLWEQGLQQVLLPVRRPHVQALAGRAVVRLPGQQLLERPGEEVVRLGDGGQDEDGAAGLVRLHGLCQQGQAAGAGGAGVGQAQGLLHEELQGGVQPISPQAPQQARLPQAVQRRPALWVLLDAEVVGEEVTLNGRRALDEDVHEGLQGVLGHVPHLLQLSPGLLIEPQGGGLRHAGRGLSLRHAGPSQKKVPRPMIGVGLHPPAEQHPKGEGLGGEEHGTHALHHLCFY
mmetsp:Transcript_28253/g.50832  ORF Transcript_28253/g.50832 Transcript_28253/m.50832 type:complete len:341 (-) Transcript_28253:1015-2037(-)